MSSKELRDQSFPSKTMNDWQSKAEESLKGRSIDSLNRNTYEKIILKPLYSRQDEQPISEYPAGSDFRRGITALGYHTHDWKVAQKISYRTVEELKNKLQEAFEKGQTAISFKVTQELFQTNQSLLETLSTLSRKYPFALNTKEYQSQVVSLMEEWVNSEGAGDIISGYIANDPISLFAEEGRISDQFLSDWVQNLCLSHDKVPHLRTALVDTTVYHNGGANAVQELGIAMATGVYYLGQLISTEMTLKNSLSKLIFQFSVGGNFFMEIAKLRAARVLWNRITEVFGAEENDRGMYITADTSTFNKTLHDPHVNLLRGANEAFAAVLGGIQYLHVESYDRFTGTTPFSERIARNTQLLLKEEAHLKKVVDPAGGSWYIESLTNQLAEKAWEFFQQIEANGGILEALKSNWVQKEISAIYQEKDKDVQNRKQSIIGTNVYANLDEKVLVPMGFMKRIVSFATDTKFDPIPPRRLSEPFEELRFKAKQLSEKTSSWPSVTLLCLGDLKEHKARLDFMKGFLATGGIQSLETKPLYSVEDVRQWDENVPTTYFCFCGTNEQYEVMGHDIFSALQETFPEARVYIAGLPDQEEQTHWLDSGIKQFIHVKSNCYETLMTMLEDMEVTSVEQESKA